MSANHTRKTQARVAERERRRTQQAQNERLKWQLPFAGAGVLILFAIAYFTFTTFAKPSQAATTGVNGPHLQVDTDKIDLGDQPLGKTVQADFKITNTGDGTLTLTPPQMATVLEGC